MSIQQGASASADQLIIPGDMYRQVREVEMMCEAFRMVPFNGEYGRALATTARHCAARMMILAESLDDRIEEVKQNG